MIDVFDFMNKGRTHLPFNHGFFWIVSLAYPGRKIRFFAHWTLIDAIKEGEKLPNEVDLIALPEWASCTEKLGGQTADVGAIKYLRSVRLAENIVIMGARGWFLEQLRGDRYIFNQARVDIVLHATLTEPVYWRSRNPLVRRSDLFGILGREFSTRIRFIVLEEVIAENLRTVVRKNTRISVMEHPAQRNVSTPEFRRSDRLCIAFLGGAVAAKGFGTFLESAKRANDRFNFACIGRAGDDYDRSQDDYFVTPPSSEKLTQERYDELILESDLICLPLNPVHYSWSASGTLLDGIRFMTPLISVRTPVIDRLVSKFGAIGYFLDTPEAIPNFIERLDPEVVRAERGEFADNLGSVANSRSYESIAKSFWLNW